MDHDGPLLPLTLVDRLVRRVFLPASMGTGQPMLSVLALQRPELLTRHAELRVRLSVVTPFVHEVARATQRDHAIIEALHNSSLREDITKSNVTPSMVSWLASDEARFTECLGALAE